jgi:hypothetical protein
MVFSHFIFLFNCPKEIQSFQPGHFHMIFLFFISLMFSVSVFSLFAYHIYLVMENTTTIGIFSFNFLIQPSQNIDWRC